MKLKITRRTRALLIILLVCGLPSLAAPGEQSVVPVDQAVADLDPLSVGLRQMNAGLRLDGEQTSLFLVTPTPRWSGVDEEPAYYRLGPGFRARVSRLEYAIPTGKDELTFNIAPRRDGLFLEIAPVNTLFELSAEPLSPADGLPTDVPAHDRAIDTRLDGRIDGRVGGLINARSSERAAFAPDPAPDDR